MTAEPTLLETARTVGAWAWRRARSSEVMGSWIAGTEEPEAAIVLFSHSRRKAGHAVSLAGLLPSIAGSPAASFVAPGPGDAEMVEALAGAETTRDRLAVLYGSVQQREIEDLRSFLAHSSPRASMPVIRAVAGVLADEEKDLASGQALCAALGIAL